MVTLLFDTRHKLRLLGPPDASSQFPDLQGSSLVLHLLLEKHEVDLQVQRELPTDSIWFARLYPAGENKLFDQKTGAIEIQAKNRDGFNVKPLLIWRVDHENGLLAVSTPHCNPGILDSLPFEEMIKVEIVLIVDELLELSTTPGEVECFIKLLPFGEIREFFVLAELDILEG